MDAYLKKQKTAFFKILLGAIVLFVFFAILNLFQAQIKNYFYFISQPVEKIFWRAGDNASSFLKSVLNVGNLEKENQNLKTENQKLLSEISFLQDIQKMGQAAEDILANCSQDNFNLAMVNVIGLNVDSDIITIDKGLASGILEGMPVINQQKTLFGKIFKSYNNFSEVMLISNKNNVLDVKILQNDAEKNSVFGVIKGKGALGIYLDLVPAEAEIKEGDILITSALDGVFPKNLLVGKIIKGEKDDQKPFQRAEVEPFFNIKKLENLFVILDYKTK
ncbi:MAG: rod shape-determining protein MreC [Patescibacteria group bacterium]